MSKIIGQYTNEEFQLMFDPSGRTQATGHATIVKGSTFNYYTQHEDKSWTNYDCKTKY